MAALHIDDPQIGIETGLALQKGGCICRLERGAATHGAPDALRSAAFKRTLRGRAVEMDRAVEPVDANMDGASLGRAAPDDDGGRIVVGTASDEGGDPKGGRDTQGLSPYRDR